jgi:GxxExxY protein
MNTNEQELFFKNEVYEIVNSAIEIINTLGHGFFEKVYENAMRVEFKYRSIPYSQQKRFTINYKDETVGDYITDLIAYNSIIIEIKTIDRITNHERGQLLNYLKISGLKVGVILNFKKAKLEWERLVL